VIATYGACKTGSGAFAERVHFPEQEIQVVRGRVVGIRAQAMLEADCGIVSTTVTADLSFVRTLDMPLYGKSDDVPMLEAIIRDGLYHEQVWALEALCRAGRSDRQKVLPVLSRYAEPPRVAYLAAKAREGIERASPECVMPAPEHSK
jgi:hypothetical protein